jgi:hypothetical protein
MLFAYLDPDMHHYAMASGEIVVQVHGTSPLQLHRAIEDARRMPDRAALASAA